MFQLFNNKWFVENEKPHFQNCQYFVSVKFDKCSLNGAVAILLFGRRSNPEIMVSSKRGEMSLISERNVTCWDPTQVFAFSLKLLSKSRPWSISLERLQCRWVDSKICMILPSSARFLFSFSSIKFRQRFCCSQLVCERQWLAARMLQRKLDTHQKSIQQTSRQDCSLCKLC